LEQIQGLEILEFKKGVLKSLDFYCGQLKFLSAQLSCRISAKKAVGKYVENMSNISLWKANA